MQQTRIRLAVLVAFAAYSIFGGANIAHAHPLHTSLAEVGYDSKSGTILVSLRVFVDDFTKAANTYQQRLVSMNARGRSSSPLVNYALKAFTLADDAGKPIVLESCGGKRVGDLMWLCFRARVTSPPKSIRVTSTILFDMYKDQINVVQATLSGRKTNALFTPGDGSKLLH